MKRREFITLLGGAVAWPFGARAQQAERVRRIGLLMGVADDREGQARVTALRHGLQELGWTDGGNIQIGHALVGPTSAAYGRTQQNSWRSPTRSSNDREDEPPRVHHAARRRGGGFAAGGARAAGGDAGDRVSRRGCARDSRTSCGGVPRRPGG